MRRLRDDYTTGGGRIIAAFAARPTAGRGTVDGFGELAAIGTNSEVRVAVTAGVSGTIGVAGTGPGTGESQRRVPGAEN